jgi:hypothetical protein
MYHMTRTGLFCSVKALAKQVHCLFHLNPIQTSHLLSFILPSTHVLPAQTMLAVHKSVLYTALFNLGYSPTCVSVHSLRASGSMALQLDNLDEDLIKKLGWWSWLTYIHSQISSLTTIGLSECMMTFHHVFYNIGS